MGCSSVWVTHGTLGQTCTNGCGLLSVGYSYCFELKYYQEDIGCSSVWVAHFRSKPYQEDMGCSSVWVAHAHLGQNNTKKTWVTLQYGLLMPFWFKPVWTDMGCSSVWVIHAILVQNHIKMTWVALQCGLLMPFWVKTISKVHRLLFSVGCSCPFCSKQY